MELEFEAVNRVKLGKEGISVEKAEQEERVGLGRKET